MISEKSFWVMCGMLLGVAAMVVGMILGNWLGV